ARRPLAGVGDPAVVTQTRALNVMAGHRAGHFFDDVRARTAVSAGQRSCGFAHAAARESRSSLGLAISARGRRLDDDRLAGIDDGGAAARKLLPAAVVAPHGVLADLAGFASGQAERTHAAVARENRAIHLLEEANGAAHAVAGIPAAASAR